MSDSLVFSDVDFSYGEHKVLDKIELKIKKGAFVALLGHNGTGKSTLMKLSLGLLEPNTGSIRILGNDIGTFNDWQKIGYVQQTVEDFDFKFPATVMEVVLMGRLSRKKGILRSFDNEDRKAAIEAMKIVGIYDLKDRRIGSLSGGQRQRVFIAKTLAGNAEILFLDEPTAAMDYNSQHSFYDLLQKLNKEMEITIILITHDIGQVLQHVNRVIVLNRKVVFDGDPQKFNKEKIWELTERI